MKIKLVKHKIMEKDSWWFELGVSWQHSEWNKYKYLFTLGLTFWSIYIRLGKQK
jgi:hypothetical protein